MNAYPPRSPEDGSGPDKAGFEAELEAWLREPPAALDDDGFTAAVMQRIEAGNAGALSAKHALALLAERERAERHAALAPRWGLWVGLPLAVLPWWVWGLPTELTSASAVTGIVLAAVCTTAALALRPFVAVAPQPAPADGVAG